jgi:hypothetical protein
MLLLLPLFFFVITNALPPVPTPTGTALPTYTSVVLSPSPHVTLTRDAPFFSFFPSVTPSLIGLDCDVWFTHSSTPTTVNVRMVRYWAWEMPVPQLGEYTFRPNHAVIASDASRVSYRLSQDPFTVTLVPSVAKARPTILPPRDENGYRALHMPQYGRLDFDFTITEPGGTVNGTIVSALGNPCWGNSECSDHEKLGPWLDNFTFWPWRRAIGTWTITPIVVQTTTSSVLRVIKYTDKSRPTYTPYDPWRSDKFLTGIYSRATVTFTGSVLLSPVSTKVPWTKTWTTGVISVYEVRHGKTVTMCTPTFVASQRALMERPKATYSCIILFTKPFCENEYHTLTIEDGIRGTLDTFVYWAGWSNSSACPKVTTHYNTITKTVTRKLFTTRATMRTTTTAALAKPLDVAAQKRSQSIDFVEYPKNIVRMTRNVAFPIRFEEQSLPCPYTYASNQYHLPGLQSADDGQMFVTASYGIHELSVTRTVYCREMSNMDFPFPLTQTSAWIVTVTKTPPFITQTPRFTLERDYGYISADHFNPALEVEVWWMMHLKHLMFTYPAVTNFDYLPMMTRWWCQCPWYPGPTVLQIVARTNQTTFSTIVTDTTYAQPTYCCDRPSLEGFQSVWLLDHKDRYGIAAYSHWFSHTDAHKFVTVVDVKTPTKPVCRPTATMHAHEYDWTDHIVECVLTMPKTNGGLRTLSIVDKKVVGTPYIQLLTGWMGTSIYGDWGDISAFPAHTHGPIRTTEVTSTITITKP